MVRSSILADTNSYCGLKESYAGPQLSVYPRGYHHKYAPDRIESFRLRA